MAGNLCEFKANLVYIVTSQASYDYTVRFCLKEEEDKEKRKKYELQMAKSLMGMYKGARGSD